MITHALNITLKYTLNNHVCKFKDELYKQLKGGAIGVSVAGDIAQLFMVWWDNQLKERLQGLRMYGRYVDDIAPFVIESTDDEETTMKRVQYIANSIHPSIKLTIAYPSNHEAGKLPILDTKQWIENGRILHTHYSKPMSNKFVVMSNSALSEDSKHNILVADLVRIMKNISVHCEPAEKEKHIQNYMHRMQISGYNQQQRVKVYTTAKNRLEKKVKDSADGTTPLYQPKHWERKRRNKEKREKKKNWFGKDFDAVYFVQPTPNGQLARQCRKVLRQAKLQVKVVERSGTTIKRILSKSDPLSTRSCDAEHCNVCDNSESQICKVRDCVYEISCSACTHTYIGESSRSLAERFDEHVVGYEKKHRSSVFSQHSQEKHQGEQPTLSVKVLERCPGDPSLRQASEAALIRINAPELNKKSEYGDGNRSRKKVVKDVVDGANQC